MRLVTFDRSGKAAVGVRVGEEIVDLSRAAPELPSDIFGMLVAGPGTFDKAKSAAAKAPASMRIAAKDAKLLPPLPNPGKIICLGLNYADHAAESPYAKPDYPVLFARFTTSLVGHGQPLIRPKCSERFDYEAEMVAVIGKRGRHVPKDKALDYVAGYSVFNDASVRDYQLRTPQWTIGKNFDGSGGFGPDFVTADELPPGGKGLTIECRLNGKVMQHANTSDMIFDVAETISTITEALTLDAGDILVMGTPAGVGFARKPPVFMKDGDVCEVESEGIGLLRNPVVDER
jgi:2-keto-4-pentenoate hydratase/2-oxohepta-3-ene-1,7-dioic acid hydratase in catechol pathway